MHPAAKFDGGEDGDLKHWLKLLEGSKSQLVPLNWLL
jgi:hypothetical protein